MMLFNWANFIRTMYYKPAPANFSRTEGSFQFSGPNIWNDVPYEIGCLTDIEVFKKSLKTYYFNLAFSDVE